MTATDKIKEDYLKQVREFLNGHPDMLRMFEQFWQAGKLREAHLCVDEVARKLGIALSPEQRKADEAFYWEFVN